MADKSHERKLVELADHLDGKGASVRLVYDDHHAGSQLALIVTSPDGLLELQVWQLQKGAVFHLLATSPAIASLFVERVGAWHESQSWTARRTRALAKRLQKLGEDLAATHAQRSTGYPEEVRAQLAEPFASNQPMVGAAMVVGGKGNAAMGIDASGLRDTLWAVAVPIETDDAGAVLRALIYDPQAKAFLAPRDVRVHLTRAYPLETLAQNWRSWGLAGQPPTMPEHPLTPVDRRRNQGEADKGETCLGCALDECFYCDIYMCEIFDLVSCMPDCDMVPDCELPGCDLDCIPCDF